MIAHQPVRGLFRRGLGGCGVEVSALGVGCWPIGGEAVNLGLPIGWSGTDMAASMAGLERAYDLGATLFDTADVYGHGRSERLVGRLVAQVPRESIVVASKVGYFTGTAAHGYEPRQMREQFARTLDNLGTDYLDIYSLHHLDFGPDDRYLHGAVDVLNDLHAQGLIRAVGMRGPHRFALDRLNTPATLRGDKIARFRAVFERVRPDVIAVRDNLLTPSARSEGVFALAEEHGCGVLVTKPLAQGLLTGAHDPSRPRLFGSGDHRSRKRWFTPPAIAIIDDGLRRLREIAGPDRRDLVRLALWSCLVRYRHAAVLVGFTRPDQVAQNLTCLGERPSDAEIDQARTVMAAVQRRLDATGEVFVDEHRPAAGASA